ncbi:MAG: hypothetical protein JRN20_03860 [Nitrososphaerota archaeon]|nr:hypothetical protein [Nitrososphaerota archaeon]
MPQESQAQRTKETPAASLTLAPPAPISETKQQVNSEVKSPVITQFAVSSIVHEKLQEEIFGRIAKNLKWIEILQRVALDALKLKGKGNRLQTDDVCELLLERIRYAEQSVSVAFVPILTSLYPHKYEISEIFSKYVAASYELAKGTGATALVTEELWEETLPDDGLGEYADSEKRVVEILIPKKDETTQDFSFLARHAYVAARNLCANVEELGTQFKEESYVASFVGLLSNRILQIEDAASSLYKLLIKSPDTKEATLTQKSERKERSERRERSIDTLLALKTGKAPERVSEKKFTWSSKVMLTAPEVSVSDTL